MIKLAFVKNTIKHFLRSPHWKSKTILNFFAILMLFNCFFMGWQLDFILSKIAPDQPTYIGVNQYLVYLLLVTYIYKLFFSNLNIAHIKPLLLLNISKKLVLHFVLFKSFINFSSIILALVLIPFAFIAIPREYPIIYAVYWVGFILIVDQIINQLVLYIRINFEILLTKIILGVVFLLIILNKIFLNFIPNQEMSLRLFNYPLENPLNIIVPFLFLFVVYQLNFISLKKMITLDNACFEFIKKQKKSIFDLLKSWGGDWYFVSLHLKQVFRDKRSRVGFYYNLIGFVVMTFVFFYYLYDFSQVAIKNNIFLVMWCIYYPVGFIQTYSLFFVSWDTNRIDFAFSNNIELRKYIDARIKVVHMVTFIIYLCLVPFSVIKPDIWWMLLMGYLFAMGCIHYFFIIISILQIKKIDVGKPIFHNAEGLNIYLFVITFFLYVIIFITSAVFKDHLDFAFLCLGSTGLVGLLFYKQWLNLILKLINKDKYFILETLRY